MTFQSEHIADHLLYRTYYKLILGDILYHLGHEPTAKNKDILHKFHKRVLGYKTIAGLTQEQLSVFLFAVGVFWAERGIFVRTRKVQPIGIENRAFSDYVKMPNGEMKQVWDLL